MEEAAELSNDLPLSFKTRSERDIAFLWDAFETNYNHGKYQFATLARVWGEAVPTLQEA